jgi:hypothetical protein
MTILVSLWASCEELATETATWESSTYQRAFKMPALFLVYRWLWESFILGLQLKTMPVSGIMEALYICFKDELMERRSKNEFNVLVASVNTCAEQRT